MLRLINNNAALFRAPSVQLSTIQLPAFADHPYESCLFTEDSSDVVDSYDTLDEAVAGHVRLSLKYNLTNSVK